MFNMITEVNESKTISRRISCQCKCEFDGKECISNHWWNNDKCWFECKNHQVCEKDYIWNHSTCSCENRKYLASIMDDSAITYDEGIESYNKETKIISTNFNQK